MFTLVTYVCVVQVTSMEKRDGAYACAYFMPVPTSEIKITQAQDSPQCTLAFSSAYACA